MCSLRRETFAAFCSAAGSLAASSWSLSVLAHRSVSDAAAFLRALFMATPASALLAAVAIVCALVGLSREKDGVALVAVAAAVAAILPLTVLLILAPLWLMAIW